MQSGEGAGENCSPRPSSALAVANLPDSDRPNLFSIIQGPSIGIRIYTRELFRELTYSTSI